MEIVTSVMVTGMLNYHLRVQAQNFSLVEESFPTQASLKQILCIIFSGKTTTVLNTQNLLFLVALFDILTIALKP